MGATTMTDQQKRRQVYDEDGRPVYGDDGKPLLETDETTAAPARSTMLDLASGAAKGAGNMFLDLGSLVHRIPGVSAATDALWGLPSGGSQASFGEVRKPLAYESTAERVGSFAPDAAMMLPAGVASVGSKVLPKLAMSLHRRALPALTKQESQFALSRGMGRASQRSVEGLNEAARKGGPVAASTARKIEAASKGHKPWSSMDTFDMVARGALGYGGFGTPAALAGAATKVISKMPRGTVAQGLAKAAPALQGIGGASGVLLASALARLFGGSDPE
jgi:hypothetical protein